jgi:uncharacterized protein (DUF488 family)
VACLVDVRKVPRSRRNPQFGREALAPSLAAHGIAYEHEPALGGFRKAQQPSVNTGWQEPAFRGYADYMATATFMAALTELEGRAGERTTCIMCAEAQWWRCHRRLISDALVVRGWKVLHLGLGARPIAHQLTPFAVVGPGKKLSYPPAQGEFEL